MKYAVEILRSAQKSLSIIQAGDRDKIKHAIRSLADDPRLNGSRKLTAREAWRIRTGKYRVFYQIFDNRLVVSVVSIGHRKDVCRK